MVSEIRVDDQKIQIIDDKSSLEAVIADQQNAAGKVSGFVRRWCALLPKTSFRQTKLQWSGIKHLILLAAPTGFEPATLSLGSRGYFGT